jgi:hypothetical protein
MQNRKRKNSRSCVTDDFGINLRSSERINEHNVAAY